LSDAQVKQAETLALLRLKYARSLTFAGESTMTEETRTAITEAKESSKRARQILLLIQVACIAVFIALWQERQDGWPITRLRAARAAVLVADCRALPLDQTKSCEEKLRVTHQPDLDKGSALLDQWHFTPEQARTWLNWMQQMMINRVINTGIPGLGATLDVNDLGLLGGITFLVMLIWLRFALWREHSNVNFVFRRCRRTDVEDELTDAYELLAMAQVLSVPQMPYEEGKRPLAWLPIALYWIPLVVQGSVLWYDRRTYSLGAAMQAILTDREFGMGIILLVLIAWLGWECMRYSRMIKLEWKQALSDIRNRPVKPSIIGATKTPETVITPAPA
jgi:hypothetical protein